MESFESFYQPLPFLSSVGFVYKFLFTWSFYAVSKIQWQVFSCDFWPEWFQKIIIIEQGLLSYLLCDRRKAVTNSCISSVQLFSRVWLFVIPWITALQASLSITNSWSSLKLMSIESMMPSNCLILCCPLLLLPSIFPSIRVFSNESVLRIRWPKYWGFSFISPSNG